MLEILDNPSPEPYWKLRYKGSFSEISFLATMDRTPAFIKLMEDTAANNGYPAEEITVYIQPIQQGRTCHLEFNLLFDPSDGKESKQVDKLFLEAGSALADAGAFFSRPYGPIADIAYARCPDTVETLRKVKGIFDPNGVMNCGRLCFGEV
jgi:FAD/FMN-containing dehydrogenase